MTPKQAALRCPFCGAEPDVEQWHGGAKTKYMVHCVNDACAALPGVTGPTRGRAISEWNRRATLPDDSGVERLLALAKKLNIDYNAAIFQIEVQTAAKNQAMDRATRAEAKLAECEKDAARYRLALLRAHNETAYGHLIKAEEYAKAIDAAQEAK